MYIIYHIINNIYLVIYRFDCYLGDIILPCTYSVNHSINFVNENDMAHTQSIEHLWKNVKMKKNRQCGTYR